jgi:hypothetical protein
VKWLSTAICRLWWRKGKTTNTNRLANRFMAMEEELQLAVGGDRFDWLEGLASCGRSNPGQSGGKKEIVWASCPTVKGGEFTFPSNNGKVSKYSPVARWECVILICYMLGKLSDTLTPSA